METTLFPTDIQPGFSFPQTLTEKYRPKAISAFLGLDKPKAFYRNLLAHPRPSATLCIGPPGSGKTSMALAFARELPCSLIHVAAQKATVDEFDRIAERTCYYPARGQFWVVLVDEADCMTPKAQLQLCSKLDGASGLRPTFGGGFEQGALANVIWIFTCNGRGPRGTEPPPGFEDRFLSRCFHLGFSTYGLGPKLADFIRLIWDRETDSLDGEFLPDFARIVKDCNNSVRDSLNAIELRIAEVQA